jgi:glycosyltransferase involved in cell wall biosynthesis
MRILFLTNFYPPHALGGQGASCQQMVEGLRRRGHEAVVLTSMHGVDNRPVAADGVYRWLYLEMDFAPWRNALLFFSERRRREKHNTHAFEQLLERFAPDLVFVWGMWNLSHALPALAEARCPRRVVYRFAEYWPTLPSQHELYWLAPGRRWYSRLPKWLVAQVALLLLSLGERRPQLRFEHAICVSEATRQVLSEAGLPMAQARVIHTGLDVQPYVNGRRRGVLATGEAPVAGTQLLRLLYAGRLAPQKGVETAITAVAELVHAQQLVQLLVAGDGNGDYVAQLRSLAGQKGLDEHVTFLGRVPAAEMPRLMHEADVLLVPSQWPEPFARVVLEGMACGLVVVATPLGGTSEIVVDGRNGLLFAAGDSKELAQKIVALAGDPAWRNRLAQAGRQTILEKFTLPVMLNNVESYLQQIVSAS